MTSLHDIAIRQCKDSEYATSEDFRRIFSEHLGGLYQLSFLLTGDHETARRCFVAGLEDAVKTNNVFQEWAHAWAKRAIIKNAIRELQPHSSGPEPEPPSRVTAFRGKSKLQASGQGHFEIESVLALKNFERFVFVMSVLEAYPEHECAALIGCSIRDICTARSRALERLAKSVLSDLYGQDSFHQLQEIH
jgi:DNA-directed RNA polymerase specialized sigma24 family protein